MYMFLLCKFRTSFNCKGKRKKGGGRDVLYIIGEVCGIIAVDAWNTNQMTSGHIVGIR